MNKSVYASPDQVSETKRHILTVLVDNEPGVLARVIGMFSGRGYNIDSLNVAEVSNDENISRITIVTHGTSEVVSQIEKQLLRIVPVHSVTNLDREDSSVEAEVALVYIYISENNKKNRKLRTTSFSDWLKDSGLGTMSIRQNTKMLVQFALTRALYDQMRPHW